MSFAQRLPLPERFLGVLPLFIGVETVLATAMLNKMHGVYGMLSLFTGHPLTLMQWLYYSVSMLIVYYYAIGFVTVLKPRPLNHAAIVCVYSVDTAFSLFYVIYFTAEWVWNEDETAPLVPGQDYSKSATQSYEYGWMLLTTIGVLAARAYFNLVLYSFYKKLLRVEKDKGVSVVDGDVENDLKNKNKLSQWLFKFEVACYKYLNTL